jgi:hypothetical protein
MPTWCPKAETGDLQAKVIKKKKSPRQQEQLLRKRRHLERVN